MTWKIKYSEWIWFAGLLVLLSWLLSCKPKNTFQCDEYYAFLATLDHRLDSLCNLNKQIQALPDSIKSTEAMRRQYLVNIENSGKLLDEAIRLNYECQKSF